MIHRIYFLLVLFGIERVNSLDSDERFNLNIWGVASGKSIEVEMQNTMLPVVHQKYYVTNLGKEPFWVELKYGTAVAWHGWVVGYSVEPREVKLVSNLGGSYYTTGIYIQNDAKERAIARVVKEGGCPRTRPKESSYDIGFDVNEFAKFVTTTIAGNIPVIGTTLANTIGFFWPSEEEDMWEQLRGKVEQLVDKKLSDVVKTVLNSNIRKLKKKVKAVHRAIKWGVHTENIRHHYMNLAQDLVGIEESFRFSEEGGLDHHKLNYAVLPLYSNIITMKLLFYRMATLEGDKLGMTNSTISQIQFFAQELMLDGALEHIAEVMEERLANCFETCNPENLFNNVVTIRTFCAFNGLEMMPHWEQWINHPESNDTIEYNDIITYSTYMGRPTIGLYLQLYGGNMGPAFVPAFSDRTVDGKTMRIRDTLKGFVILYSDKYIYHVKSVYENSEWNMGLSRGGSHQMQLTFIGKYLKKIDAFGDETLTGVTMYFSNGKYLSFGYAGGRKTTFELEGHHIVGVYFGHDDEAGGYRNVNLAVSYMVDNKYIL